MRHVNFTALIRGLIIAAGTIFALFLGLFIGQSGSFLPLILAGGIAMVAVTAALPSWVLVLCVAFSLLTGRTGLGFGYWELFAAALIARWALIVPFQGGLFGAIEGKFTFLCIAGFSAILAFHGLPAFIGAPDAFGRRLTIMALAAVGLSYLLLSRKLDLSKIHLLPWAGLLVGGITAGFDLLNILVPAALPYTFFIYNGQNWELIAQARGGSEGAIRISGFRELGLGLSFLALSKFATVRHLNPRNFLLYVLSTLFGTSLILAAGYRSYVMRVALATFLAAYHRSKWWLVAAVFSVVFSVGGLLYIHSYVVDLPLPAQRSLSFLPGNWDWRTKSDAEHGIGWRATIRDIYFQKIFPDSWLFGRGLQYDERTESMTWMLSSEIFSADYFVMMQGYHSGLVSTLDFVGVAGTIFLLAASIRGMMNSLFIMKHRGSASTWHVWTALMFLTTSAAFWYTGFFERTFPFFAIFMCLLEIAKIQLTRGFAEPAGPASSKSLDYEMENDAESQ